MSLQSSLRKRKKPSYLEDYEQQSLCSLCQKPTDGATDMAAITEASSSTMSAVLQKSFKDNKQASGVDFSRGFLCAVCTYLVTTLDKLETEGLTLKNLILSLLGNECQEIHDDESLDGGSLGSENGMESKIETNNEDDDEEEVPVVESLLEKRGYKYLVKWENYPEAYNRWEPRFSLPKFIVKVRERSTS